MNQELHSQICLSLRAFDVTKGCSDVSKSNLSHAYSMHCRHSSNCRVVCGFDLAKQDVRPTSGDVACLTHKFIHNHSSRNTSVLLTGDGPSTWPVSIVNSEATLTDLTRTADCMTHVNALLHVTASWLRCGNWHLTLWRPLLRYGYNYKAPSSRPGQIVIVLFDIRALWRSALSARLPKCPDVKNYNDDLTQSGTWCFIVVSISQQWASKG